MKHSEKAISTFYKDNKTVKSKGHKKGKRTEPIFNLRLSEEEKYQDGCQWFKDYAEWIVPAYSSTIDGYKEMKLSYDVYNDNLNGFKKELDDFCNKMGENIGQVEEEIQPYPKLHNIVNVLKGEMIKRQDNFKIVLLSLKAIKDKNNQLIEALKASIEEDLALEIEKIQLELQQVPPEQIQEIIDSMRQEQTPEGLLKRNFQSEWEIFYNKALKYAYFDQNIKSKEVETLEDVILADRCFVYSGWLHGKPHLEVRNPLYSGFQKAPNEMMVHKGDYFWYKKPITIADAYNNYGHLLSDEEIAELGIHTYQNNTIDKRHSLGPNEGGQIRHSFDEEMFSDIVNNSELNYESKRVGLHQGQGIDRRQGRESLIWETHIEFKAFRELIFLSYIDDYNVTITIPVSKDFKIPKEAKEVDIVNQWGHKTSKYTWVDELSGTEYSAEKLWIPRKYEVIRLGNDIYPICREVPYQMTNTSNPYSNFTLSTFGAIFTSRNAKSVSLLQRAIPAYFQYLFIKHIQNRELSKYQGYIQSVDLDQIPDKLGQDIDGELIRDPVAVWMLYRKQLGVDFYSGSQTSTGGLAPNTRSPGSSGYLIGTAGEIYNLQQMLAFIDAEIGMAMGVSPQRISNFSTYSNVTDNQQALAQSHNITEPYFFYIKQVWKDALLDYINNFRTYCYLLMERNQEPPIFHYILPDGTEELFKVTPKMLEAQDIGIFIGNSLNDQRYQDMMLQMSQSISQNAGEGLEAISALIKAITSGVSPEETHKIIEIEAQKQEERMMRMEQQKAQLQLENEKKAISFREDVQAHDLDKINLKGKWDLEKAALDLYKFTEDKDADNNNVPDYLEALEAVRKMTETKAKIEAKDKELELREQEIAIKKQAAKNKPKSK